MRLAVIVLMALSVACQSSASDPTTGTLPGTTATTGATSGDPAPIGPGFTATVAFVADGDSFTIEQAGTERRVRLIGINAPERDECYGAEARDTLENLLAGRPVLIVADVEPEDQYGRLLAYAYVDDVLVNAEMARRGAALVGRYEPNTTLQATLEEAESQAERALRGMWSPDACGSVESGLVVVAMVADAPGRDDENLNGEFVELRNDAAVPVAVGGWTVRDESSVHRYQIPDGTILAPGASMTIFTGCGQDRAGEYYWCADTPVWDNDGDTVLVIDSEGAIRLRFGY